MPKVYAPLRGNPAHEPYTTYYQVFVGQGAAFEASRGKRLDEDFPGGGGNTILIIEAGEAVPWTKPEDIPYAADRPLPEVGGVFPADFRAALADGSVRTFPRTTSERALRAWITGAGNDAHDRE